MALNNIQKKDLRQNYHRILARNEPYSYVPEEDFLGDVKNYSKLREQERMKGGKKAKPKVKIYLKHGL